MQSKCSGFNQSVFVDWIDIWTRFVVHALFPCEWKSGTEIDWMRPDWPENYSSHSSRVLAKSTPKLIHPADFHDVSIAIGLPLFFNCEAHAPVVGAVVCVRNLLFGRPSSSPSLEGFHAGTLPSKNLGQVTLVLMSWVVFITTRSAESEDSLRPQSLFWIWKTDRPLHICKCTSTLLVPLGYRSYIQCRAMGHSGSLGCPNR